MLNTYILGKWPKAMWDFWKNSSSVRFGFHIEWNILGEKSRVHSEMWNPRYKEGFNSNFRGLYPHFTLIYCLGKRKIQFQNFENLKWFTLLLDYISWTWPSSMKIFNLKLYKWATTFPKFRAFVSLFTCVMSLQVHESQAPFIPTLWFLFSVKANM